MSKFIPTIVHCLKDRDDDMDDYTQDFEATWFWFLETSMFMDDDDSYGRHKSLIEKIDYTKSHKLQNRLLNMVEEVCHMDCSNRHEVFYEEVA